MSSDVIKATELGRFSSQLLNQGGAQLKVKHLNDKAVSTFDQSRGGEIAPPADSTTAALGSIGKIGGVNRNEFYALRAHFEKLGASKSNSETMALITIDAARSAGKASFTILDDTTTQSSFKADMYKYVNRLRNPGDMQDKVNKVNNAKSLKARDICA
jgi:hypothetical protein